MQGVELTGGALSDQQVRSIAEAQARTNIWHGSIRSGKTVGSLVRWLIHVAQTRDLPGELFMFGRTRDSLDRNVFGPLRDRNLFGPLCRQIHYTSGAPHATILGQTVHVLGASDRASEEKVRGLTSKGAYGDELTICPEEFFKQALGRISVDGGKMFGTTNPDNPAHWLRQDYLLREHELDLKSWQFGIDDNAHFLGRSFVDAIKSEYTGLWYKRFVLGEWVQSEGAIYEQFDPDVHVVDELPPLAQVLGVGADYGTTNPFAALMLAITRDGRLAVTREYRHDPKKARRQLTDAEFSREFREWVALEPERPRWIVVDPSAESFQLQLHRDGMVGLVDADNSVADGIRLIASLLATRRLIVHKSCRGLIDEFPGYSWDDTAAKKGDDRPIKANDHSLDGLRYVAQTTRGVWERSVPISPWVAPAAA